MGHVVRGNYQNGERMSQTVNNQFATEAGHWYRPDGSPCYSIESKDGTPRPTTLRDARKLGLLPSVTTISKIVAAPGLERWKLNQAILSALTIPRIEGESDENLIYRIIQDGQEQSRKRAQEGTAIHGSLEKAFTGSYPGSYSIEHAPYVHAVMSEIKERWGMDRWSAERSFAGNLGYGGKVDLHRPDIVIDFKTKEFDTVDDKKLAWPENAMQLAAYREGLQMSDAECFNIFVSTTRPGLVHVHQWTEIELQNGWEKFKCLLHYWKLDKGIK